ncbi:2-oxo acid dehydrogenase subunit E2 [Lewinella sp. LCG006]|uniref:2-oxo acid dehydrogenase subunit E2 n=1 Tax=Lewinella sp. LCG006 TaxID=3231911 RepID=UPI00345FCC27
MESNALNTPWRKTASTIYQKPNDSKIIGSVEFDITDLNTFIQQKRSEGLKLTPTHVFTLATARAIAEKIPEMNSFIRRGKVELHPQIDAMVSVLLPKGQMGSVKLENVDKLSLEETVEQLSNKIKIARQQNDESEKLKNGLGSIPWPFRQWVYRLIYLLNIRWGIDLPGLSTHRFGSFVVSNIGSLGLDVGYPALFPVANVPFVLILGGIQEKPWVVDGEICIRTIMKVAIAMDHRMIDASHGGQLFAYLKRIVKQPSLLEKTLPYA